MDRETCETRKHELLSSARVAEIREFSMGGILRSKETMETKSKGSFHDFNESMAEISIILHLADIVIGFFFFFFF